MNRFPRLFLFSLLPFSLALPVALSTPDSVFAAPVTLMDSAKISARTLPNGVRSVVQENPGGDLVSVQVWVRAGSRFENKDNNGVTHLIETLALRASKNFPQNPRGNGGVRGTLESLGANVSSLSSRDSLFYTATVASPFLNNALRALSDATLAPDLSDANIQAAKDEISAEITRTDPTKIASDLAYATAFQTHPYRRSTDGTLSSIAALTGAKVRAYHQARFAGAHISVVIVGDVARENAHKLVAQYFGAATKAATQPAILEEKPLAKVTRQSQRGVLPISIVTLGFRSPGIQKPVDVVASDVLLAYWKEGRNAALKRVLKGTPPLGSDGQPEESGEEAASEDGSTPDDDAAPEAAPAPEENGATNEEDAPLALAFNVDYLTQRDSGLFLISLIAPRDRNAAIQAILDEIARVKTDGLTTEELSQSKEILRQQYVRQSETISGQAGALGFYDTIDSYQFAATYLDRINKITNDDIRRIAEEYLKPETRVEATLEAPRTNPQQPDKGTITARLFE